MGFLALLRGVGGFIARGARALFSSPTARSVATIGAGTGLGVAAGNLFGGGGDDVGGDIDGAGVRGSRTFTMVITVDPEGNIIRRKTLKGSPWLMRRDFMTMKRVLKTIAKGNSRVPRRTVMASPMAALKDKILTKALDSVTCPPLPCPTG